MSSASTVSTSTYFRTSHLSLPAGADAVVAGITAADHDHIFAVYHFPGIPAGVSHGWETLMTYISGLKMLFAPGGMQNLGGFGAMADLFPDHWEWHAFWNLTALLALILAFMNIIPIPGLDGGHILFTLWEIVTRKKPSDKFLSYAQTAGMVLLLALMVLANGNDLWRWISQYF